MANENTKSSSHAQGTQQNLNENFEKNPGSSGRQKDEDIIDKIRVGDIRGPCGNTNCKLAHKVRNYIKNLDTYKAKAQKTGVTVSKGSNKKNCGTCVCNTDPWHKKTCPDYVEPSRVLKIKSTCTGCAGMARADDTCEMRLNRHYGTGASPDSSTTQIQFVTKVTEYRDAVLRSSYLLNDSFKNQNSSECLHRKTIPEITTSMVSTSSKSTTHVAGKSKNKRYSSNACKRQTEFNVYNVET